MRGYALDHYVYNININPLDILNPLDVQGERSENSESTFDMDLPGIFIIAFHEILLIRHISQSFHQLINNWKRNGMELDKRSLVSFMS